MFIDFTHTYRSYNQILEYYGRWDYVCPKCGKKGYFGRHGVYERFFCVLENGTVAEKTVRILRLKCKNCGSTHAILTWDMIPFCTYSLELIFEISCAVCILKKSVLNIMKETSISFQMLYHFLQVMQSYFSQHFSEQLIDYVQNIYSVLGLSGMFFRRVSTIFYPIYIGIIIT